ncbi:outer membrane beta-barrel protein [Rufibacter soli]
MKRLYTLLSAIMMAAAIALPSRAETTGFTAPSAQDTLLVKLKNNARVLVVVKDLSQLKELKSQSIDSLITVLEKHAAKIEQAGKQAGDKPMVVTIDRSQANTANDVKITVTQNGKEEVIKEGNKKIRILSDIKIDIDNDDAADKTSVKVNVGQSDTTKTDDDDDHKKKNRNPRVEHDMQLDLGISQWANQSMHPSSEIKEVDLKPLGSRYVSLNSKWHYRLGGQESPLRLITGFTLDFHNYMFQDNLMLVNKDGRADFVKADPLSLDKSKLATTTFNIPLELGLHFKNDKGKTNFKIGAGGFAGYTLGSHTKIKYSLDGDTKKDKEKDDFNLQDVQYGLTGFIGIRSLEMFVKYNLNELFEKNEGPKANAVAVGFRVMKF